MHEEVSECGGDEPGTHHHSLVFRRSHLADEGDADGAQEEFGEGQNEVGADEKVRGDVCHVVVHAVSVGRHGKSDGAGNHEEIGAGSDEHTETNLDRCFGFFAFLAEPAEERDADGSEHHHEAGVELLEDGCADGDGLGKLLIVPIEIGCGGKDEGCAGEFSFGFFALEEGEGTEDHEDGSHEVGHVKHHGLHAGGRSGGVVTRKEGEGETVLVERHPEEDHDCHDEDEAGDAFAGLSGREFFGLRFVGGGSVFLLGGRDDLAEGAHAEIVDGDGEDEGGTCHGEGVVIGVCFAHAEGFL